ncbi:MAG: undecaprenyl-diphosphate phosphatase [Planctomycetes bacterium]|nr:undecaprenyl-diphosphate phosphatase [Planctomycetota bacterium]
MSLLDAIVLGLVQGLTEFIPVSSTAHLLFATRWLGMSARYSPEQLTAVVAVVQLGTLAAVLAFFAKELFGIAHGCLRPRAPESRESMRLLGFMVWGTIPIVILGLAFKKLIEGPWTKNLLLIAGALAFWSVVLAVAERFGRKTRGQEAATSRDAWTLGFFQVFALIPGSSRSGTTLCGGLFSGLTREATARLSFLMSIPAVGAAGVLELHKALKVLPKSDLGLLAVATAISAASGYLAIGALLRFFRTRSSWPFIVYRLALAALIAGMVLTGKWTAQ